MDDKSKEDKLFGLVLEVVDFACQALYKFSIQELRDANPSFDDISGLCTDFAEMFAHSAPEKFEATDEIVDVMKSAADAINSGCDKTIVDCAYHLEDFLDRHIRNVVNVAS